MKSYRQLSTANAGTSMHQNQWLVKANGNGARLMASILRVREEEGRRGRGRRCGGAMCHGRGLLPPSLVDKSQLAENKKVAQVGRELLEQAICRSSRGSINI